MKARQFMFGMVFSALMGGGMALGGYKLMEEDQPAPVMQTENPNVRYSSFLRDSDVVVPEGLNFVTAAQIVTPAVVHITSEFGARTSEEYASRGGGSGGPMDQFLKEFFGEGYSEPRRRSPRGGSGSGSGVIIAANGYIVTNNHVIDNASTIKVVLNDNRSYTANVIGTDPNTDLALLKINEDNLPFIKYGNSDQVNIGEWVLAVGNPFNLTSTVTAGIVSAKSRAINILQRPDRMGIESFIQTDAVVNPGNSGGALVNLNGDLIGINTAIASQTGTFTGYSFAVPSSIVSKVVDDLLKYGEVQRALLGVEIQTVTAELAKEKKLKDVTGVHIGSVRENSSAKDAGLEAGDVIRQINDVPIGTVSQLQEQVARYRPGDKVKVGYERNGKFRTTTATLKNSSGDTELVARAASSKSVTVAGASFDAPGKQELSRLQLEGGAKISNVENSVFKDTGMKDGFIITRIDKQAVTSPADVEKFLKNHREGLLIEGVYPDGRKSFYALGW
jgi:serine protease Do